MSEHNVHKALQRYSLKQGCPTPQPPTSVAYTPPISGTLDDTGVSMQAEPSFIQDWTESLDLETSSTYEHTYTHLQFVEVFDHLKMMVLID